MPQPTPTVTSDASDNLIFDYGLLYRVKQRAEAQAPWATLLQNAREEGKVITSHIKVLFILK